MWIFSGKSSNESNRLHKRALIVLLEDYATNIAFGGLQMLNLKNPYFLYDIPERNLRHKGPHPTIKYNLRIKDVVQLSSTKTVRYGLNSPKFRGSMLWTTLSDRIKSATNDKQFKNKIKDWTESTCCCSICR